MDIKKLLELLKIFSEMPTELKEIIEGLEAAQKVYTKLSSLGIELPDFNSLLKFLPKGDK